jgi:LysM domain
MPMHTVSQGECVSSIAATSGFTWQTIWEHANNAALRRLRKDPNVLYAGDQLFIPDLQTDPVACATGQKHTFVLQDAPTKIKLLLLDQDAPRAGVPYSLQIDGVWTSGTTDGSGYVDHPIPPGAQAGQLIVGTGASKDVYQLQLGAIDPIETESGVKGRLLNLGFGGDDLSRSVSAFQKKQGLPVTGALDAASQARLKEKFGQ